MSVLAAPVLAGGLAIVGVVAAGPGSAWLASARWTDRSPMAALVLWQALCLCGGLSLTGAALVVGVEPLGHHLPAALDTLVRNTFHGRPFDGLVWWRIALLILALVFAAALLIVLGRCFVLALLRRRAHRGLLDLLTGNDDPAGSRQPTPTGVRVLDHAAPMAYSVPGWHTRLVLTAGLVELLTPPQLAAVVAHERAHLQSHHDLLLLPFQAWAVALGRLPGVDAARRAVAALAEMQADDAAARQVGTGRAGQNTVASALAAVVLADPAAHPGGRPGVPAQSEVPEIGGTAVIRRVRRLQQPRPLPAAVTVAVWIAAAALLGVPTLVLFIGWG